MGSVKSKNDCRSFGWLWLHLQDIYHSEFVKSSATIQYECVCMRIQVYMHIKHTYIHTCMHTYIHTCMHTYIHTYIHTINERVLDPTVSGIPCGQRGALREPSGAPIRVVEAATRGERKRDFIGIYRDWEGFHRGFIGSQPVIQWYFNHGEEWDITWDNIGM